MKKAVIIGIAVFSSILIFFGVKNIFGKKTVEEEPVLPTPTITYPTITDDIKVDLTAQNDNRVVFLKISGLDKDVVSIEYELTYQTGEGLPRGVLGKINVDGEKEVSRDDIVLGTCSSGKCVYDTGVEKVMLSLKFNLKNSVKVFQKEYQL